MVIGSNYLIQVQHHKLVFLLILFSGLISSCGGSSDNAGGSPIDVFSVPLTVAQTIPLADAPGANGDAAFTVNTETGLITGSATVSGLSGNPTAAHIHAGALGQVGEVIITLAGSDESVSADGFDETWSVPEGTLLSGIELASYSAGELYVNVHTEENSAGELRGQLINSAPEGSYTFTITNTALHQPLTAPIVFIRTDPVSLIDSGTPANNDDDIIFTDSLVDIGGFWFASLGSVVEDANNEPMVARLTQFAGIQIVNDFAVVLNDRANPDFLMPGESVSVTLTPGESSIETQVFGLVSKVLCSNDGYAAVDFQLLPASEISITAPAFDLGTEVNSTQLDTWVDACGGTGNTHMAELQTPQLHPGQSGTQIPPGATTSIYDFAMGDEFLRVTITPN